MGRVGRSIALGRASVNPTAAILGPSAWEPPLYPYLIGGVFKVLGVYTYASAWFCCRLTAFRFADDHSVYFIANRVSVRAWRLVGAGMGIQSLCGYWSIHWIWTRLSRRSCCVDFSGGVRDGAVGRVSRLICLERWWGIGGLANPSDAFFSTCCGLWDMVAEI